MKTRACADLLLLHKYFLPTKMQPASNRWFWGKEAEVSVQEAAFGLSPEGHGRRSRRAAFLSDERERCV